MAGGQRGSCVHPLMLSLTRALSPEMEAECLARLCGRGDAGSGSAPWVCGAEAVPLTNLKVSAGSRLSCAPPAEVSSRDGGSIPRI